MQVLGRRTGGFGEGAVMARVLLVPMHVELLQSVHHNVILSRRLRSPRPVFMDQNGSSGDTKCDHPKDETLDSGFLFCEFFF